MSGPAWQLTTLFGRHAAALSHGATGWSVVVGRHGVTGPSLDDAVLRALAARRNRSAAPADGRVPR
jgi:hypothetical protein